MFTPLNEEFNSEKLKKISLERKLLKKMYYNSILNKKIDEILSYDLVYEENLHFLERIKEYALYNFIKLGKKKINIEINIITKFKRPLMEYVDILISDGQYIKARKLLNIAKERGLTCNKYYELESRIKKEYKYVEKG